MPIRARSHRVRVPCLALLVALNLPACGDDDPEETDVNLRSGASLVYDYGQKKFGGIVGSFSVPALTLRDVARDGDHVVATLLWAYGSIVVWHKDADPKAPPSAGSAWGGGGYLFMESFDRGRSWKQVGVSGIDKEPSFGNVFIRGVHLWNDHAVLVGHSTIEHPMGTEVTFPAAEVGLDGRTAKRSPELLAQPFLALPWAAGSRLETIGAVADHTGAVTLFPQTYDLTGRTYGYSMVPGDLPCAPEFVPRQAGEGAVGHCRSGDDGGLCQISATADSSHAACMSRMMLPAGVLFGRTMAATPGGDFSILSDSTDSWAVKIDPTGTFTRIPLGPGTFGESFAGVHPWFGGLIALHTSERLRLIDLSRPEAPEEVVLPATPCGGSCGAWVEHVAAVPLGDDRYLDFYSVDSFADSSYGSHYRIYATVDKATRKPIVDAAPWPSGDSPIPAYPEAQAASPLQKQCMAAAKCLAEAGSVALPDWRDCLADFQSIGTLGSPALTNFLSVPPDQCYSLLAFYPQRALLFTSPCTVGCRGDAIVAECGFGSMGGQPETTWVKRVVDCRLYGSMCRMPEGASMPVCTDGSAELKGGACTEKDGAVVDYGGGLLLVYSCPELGGQTCLPEPSNPALSICGFPECAAPSKCDGDLAIGCSAGSPGSRSDCSIKGLNCVVNGVFSQCNVPRPSPSFVADVCEGKYLVYKGEVPNDVRFIDCTELGGTCNDDNPQRPVCR